MLQDLNSRDYDGNKSPMSSITQNLILFRCVGFSLYSAHVQMSLGGDANCAKNVSQSFRISTLEAPPYPEVGHVLPSRWHCLVNSYRICQLILYVQPLKVFYEVQNSLWHSLSSHSLWLSLFHFALTPILLLSFALTVETLCEMCILLNLSNIKLNHGRQGWRFVTRYLSRSIELIWRDSELHISFL